MFCPDDGGSRLLRNSGTNLPNYKTLCRGRPVSVPTAREALHLAGLSLKHNQALSIYLTILFKLCEIKINLKFLSDEKKCIPQHDRGDPV